jgi:hypothetical protein
VGYLPEPIPHFLGGLNLRDKPDVINPSEAIDLLNVEFTVSGAVAQRAGWDNLATGNFTNRVTSLHPFYSTSGTKQLVAGCGSRLEVLEANGSINGSPATGLTASSLWDFARFGGPNNERVYAGNGSDTLRYWDGSTWTSPGATMPRAGALCVLPTSNRLVATRFHTTTGGPGGITSSPSHVFFSNPGDPATWGATDSIQISPGDGEKIQAVVAFRNFAIIFKETKFAVVYGESVDSGGGARFNFRTIDTGVGLASPRAVAVSENGVYFLDRRGVFLTTGGEPTLVSDVVTPLFQGGTSAYYLGGELEQGSITECTAEYWNDRLYLAFPTGSANDRVLVYDDHADWWTLYDFPAGPLATFRPGDEPRLVWGRASGDNRIDYFGDPDFTNDNGTAITSRWRSGWPDFGIGSQKVVRGAKAWGSGVVDLAVSADYAEGYGESTQLNLTPDGAEGSLFGGSGTFGGSGIFGDSTVGLEAASARKAVRGTVFSTTLSNSTLDQSWGIQRLQHNLRMTRRPSVRKTENI